MSVDVAACHDKGELLASSGLGVGDDAKLHTMRRTLASTKNSVLNVSVVLS